MTGGGPPLRALVIALFAQAAGCSLLVDQGNLTGGRTVDVDAGVPTQDAEAPPETVDASDGGCVEKSLGPLRATSVSSDGKGACNWVSLPGATTRNDGLAAQCDLKAVLQETSELFVAGFGLTVPESAEVRGIRVEILRSAEAPLGTTISDVEIRLAFGSERSEGRSRDEAWPNVFQTATYGDARQTWGSMLTPAKVNAASFGVALKARSQGLDPTRAKVDGVDVTVFYCE